MILNTKARAQWDANRSNNYPRLARAPWTVLPSGDTNSQSPTTNSGAAGCRALLFATRHPLKIQP